MTLVNALLDQSALPRFEAIEPDQIIPAMREAIARHRGAMGKIQERGDDDFNSVVLASERADFALSSVWSPIGHLAAVADTPALRAAHGEVLAMMTAYLMEAAQDEQQFSALNKVAEHSDFRSFSTERRRAIELGQRGFTLSGVALDSEARQRFLAIGVALSELGTQFDNAVLDATEAWSEHVTDEALLDGLPDSDRAILADYARQSGLPGWLVRLREPMSAARQTG